jgi:hypothetical protein
MINTPWHEFASIIGGDRVVWKGYQKVRVRASDSTLRCHGLDQALAMMPPPRAW